MFVLSDWASVCVIHDRSRLISSDLRPSLVDTHSTKLELLDNTLTSAGLDTSSSGGVDVGKHGHGGQLEMGLNSSLHGKRGVLGDGLEGPSVDLLLGRHLSDGVILEHLGVDVTRRRLELGQSEHCVVGERE